MCLAFGRGCLGRAFTKSSNLVGLNRVFDVGYELPKRVFIQNICIQYILCPVVIHL